MDEEVGWHPSNRTSGTDLMRQGSHGSALTYPQQEGSTQSGLLEQLMSYDSGLQVTPCCCLPDDFTFNFSSACIVWTMCCSLSIYLVVKQHGSCRSVQLRTAAMNQSSKSTPPASARAPLPSQGPWPNNPYSDGGGTGGVAGVCTASLG